MPPPRIQSMLVPDSNPPVAFQARADTLEANAWRVAVAPMMDCTDRHCRYFLRLVSPRIRLYTEMLTAAAILRGDTDRWLRFDAAEHPVGVQLGGSDPVLLAGAAARAAGYGYDEINLNAGCPSELVCGSSATPIDTRRFSCIGEW